MKEIKILLCLIMVLLLVGCNNSEENIQEKIDNANINIECPDELKVNARVTYDVSDVMLYIENIGEAIGELNINISYKNSDNEEIDNKNYTYSDIRKNGIILAFGRLPLGEDNLFYIPDVIDVKITSTIDKKIIDRSSDVNLDYYIKENTLYVVGKNESGKAINELDLMVVFYKDDKMIHYYSIIGYDIDEDNMLAKKIELPDDFDYDNLDVLINKAI